MSWQWNSATRHLTGRCWGEVFLLSGRQRSQFVSLITTKFSLNLICAWWVLWRFTELWRGCRIRGTGDIPSGPRARLWCRRIREVKLGRRPSRPSGHFRRPWKRNIYVTFRHFRAFLCHSYLISRSRSDSDDGAFQNFGLCLLGNDDATGGLCQCFGSLDENAVEQWNQFLCDSGLVIRK